MQDIPDNDGAPTAASSFPKKKDCMERNINQKTNRKKQCQPGKVVTG
jgi:hypothetical protein